MQMKNSNIVIFFTLVACLLAALFYKSDFQLAALNVGTVVAVIAIALILTVVLVMLKGKQSGFGKNAVLIIIFLIFLTWLLN